MAACVRTSERTPPTPALDERRVPLSRTAAAVPRAKHADSLSAALLRCPNQRWNRDALSRSEHSINFAKHLASCFEMFRNVHGL